MAPASKMRACASPRATRAGRHRFARNHRARDAAVLGGISAGKQIHAVDERRRDHRGPGAHVEQERHRDAVDAIADVAGRRAAHVEIGNAAQYRSHAGQHLDDAKRVREGTWDQARLAAWDVQRAELLALFAEHADLGGRRFYRLFAAAAAVGLAAALRSARLAAAGAVGGTMTGSRKEILAVMRARIGMPSRVAGVNCQCVTAMRAALAKGSLPSRTLTSLDAAVLRNHQLEHDLRRAVRALGVRHGLRRNLRRRDDLRLLCQGPRRYQAEQAGHADRERETPQFSVSHPSYPTQPRSLQPEAV